MKKTSKFFIIFYVALAISLISTYAFLDNFYQEKYPTYMENPTKTIFPLLVTDPIIQFTIIKEYEIGFDEISNVFTEVENFPKILPRNMPFVEIIEKTENYVLAKEKFSERGLGAEFLVEHKWDSNQHIMKILDGDAKDSTITLTFEKINNSTKITTDVNIKFKGFLSVLRFIPQSNLMHATETVLDTFFHYVKGFDNKFEKQIDELYRNILLRPADNVGLEYYSNQLKNKIMTLDEIKEILKNSNEYKSLKNIISDGQNDKIHYQNTNFIKHELLTSIQVGDLPIGITSNPITNKIYVTNNNDNTILIIDSTSNKIINSLDVEKGPSGIDVNPNTNQIYVSNYYSDSISVIDGFNDSLMDVIIVNDTPRNIVINNITDKIYVANYFGNSIDIIDGKTNSIINSVYIEKPWGISIDDETNTIYITSKKSLDLFVLDGDTNNVSILTINQFSDSYPSEVEFISGKIILSYTNFLLIIDESTLKETVISMGNNISEIEVNEKFNLVYALDLFSNVVYVTDISVGNIIEIIPTGKYPIGIEYESENNILYVVNEYSNSVSVFSLVS
jgi:YVTN family beta-propeller protein